MPQVETSRRVGISGRVETGRAELQMERAEFQVPEVHPSGFMGLMLSKEAATGNEVL